VRLTYANAMATIAVFVALGAGAYAAGLAPDSVKSRHIVNGQVKDGDLAGDAVSSLKVADGSLLGADFAPGEVPADGSPAASMVNARVALPAVEFSETRFAPISGVISEAETATGDDASVRMLSPPVTTVAQDLAMQVGVSGGDLRGVSLVTGGAPSELSCGVQFSAPPCQDTNTQLTIPPNTTLSLRFNAESGPVVGGVPATTALVTWRATTPPTTP
jgi:hypothetical protein